MIAGIQGPTFEGYFKDITKDSNDLIAAQDAAVFLKKSQLPKETLGEIWSICDKDSKGFLSKKEFFLSLKLIAIAQNSSGDYRIADNVIKNSYPLPNFVLESNFSFNNISMSDYHKYKDMFLSYCPQSTVIPGNTAKEILIKCGLPFNILTQIWDLSDLDKDCALNKEEFIIAMYIIEKYKEYSQLPTNKQSLELKNYLKSLSASTAPTLSMTLVAPGWIVPKDFEFSSYQKFLDADLDHDGFVSGHEIRDTFLQSGLPQQTLADIWNLCDIKQNGLLNKEQFALASFFIAELLSRKMAVLPHTLSPSMMPPSFRSEHSANIMGQSQQFPTTSPSGLTLEDFGIVRESDNVLKEVEKLKKERLQAEDKLGKLKQEQSQISNEYSLVLESLNKAKVMRDQLVNQQGEAQNKLQEYRNTKSNLENEHISLKQELTKEKNMLENLKCDLVSQENTFKEQTAEAGKLRVELSNLHAKEIQMEEKLNSYKKRKQQLEQENSQARELIEKNKKAIESLGKLKSELSAAINELSARKSGISEAKLEEFRQLSNRDLTDFSLACASSGPGNTMVTSALAPKNDQHPQSDPFGFPVNFEEVAPIFDKQSNKNPVKIDDFDPFGLPSFAPQKPESGFEQMQQPSRPPATYNLPKDKMKGTLSETEQMQWAKIESEELARKEESLRFQEQRDLELALRLSKMGN